MPTLSLLYEEYKKACALRQCWENTWQECYAYALPQRETVFCPSAEKIPSLYDATAMDATDQLGALMLSELTPPWMEWFRLSAGSDLSENEKAQLLPTMQKISDILKNNLDLSNFSSEIHQCYLDLITVGTACLLFEEAPLGTQSCFHFTAVPLNEICLGEGPTGRLDKVFRSFTMDEATFIARFGLDKLPRQNEKNKEPIRVIEALIPRIKGGYDSYTFLHPDCQHVSATKESPFLLKQAYYSTSPFVAFRWLKAPGEVYGRSPVMKALPDIKTANKVVELILKNATISVTGIWLAEDDGVLNPATINLTPGAIIPKAVGSKGLTPLEAPGKFDVSQLVIKDLREHIRHALLGDKLGTICENNKMTATEVLERSEEMIRILGATYGRLQSELLTPLIERAIAILRKRGEIPEVFLDGRILNITYKSPRAEIQSRKQAQDALNWLNAVKNLGTEALQKIDTVKLMRWLSEKLALPTDFILNSEVS